MRQLLETAILTTRSLPLLMFTGASVAGIGLLLGHVTRSVWRKIRAHVAEPGLQRERNRLEELPQEILTLILQFLDFQSIRPLLEAYPFLKQRTVLITHGKSEKPPLYFDIRGIQVLHHYPRWFSPGKSGQRILLVLCDLKPEMYTSDKLDKHHEFPAGYESAIKYFTRPIFDRILRNSKTRAVFVYSAICPEERYTPVYIQKKKEMIYSGVSFIERLELTTTRALQKSELYTGILPLGVASGLQTLTIIFPRMKGPYDKRPVFSNFSLPSELQELFIGYHGVLPQIFNVSRKLPWPGNSLFSLVDFDDEAWNVPNCDTADRVWIDKLNHDLVADKARFCFTFLESTCSSIQITGGPILDILSRLKGSISTLNITETRLSPSQKLVLSSSVLQTFNIHSRISKQPDFIIMAPKLSSFYYQGRSPPLRFTLGYTELSQLERLVVHNSYKPVNQQHEKFSEVLLGEGHQALKLLSLHGCILPYMKETSTALPVLEHVYLSMVHCCCEEHKKDPEFRPLYTGLWKSEKLRSALFEHLKPPGCASQCGSLTIDHSPKKRLRTCVKGFKDVVIDGRELPRFDSRGQFVEYYTVSHPRIKSKVSMYASRDH